MAISPNSRLSGSYITRVAGLLPRFKPTPWLPIWLQQSLQVAVCSLCWIEAILNRARGFGRKKRRGDS
jgi:hypothetical protein